MTRIGIVVLCLLASVVGRAFAATAASAQLPEYKVCVASSGGQFSDKLCSMDVGVGAGAFELENWTHAKKLAFKATDGASKLQSYIPSNEKDPGAGGTIVETIGCTASKGTGSVTGPKSSELTLELTGCSGGGKKCTSAGQKKPGTIVTSALEGTLGYVDAAGTKAGLRINPKVGVRLAEFSCEGLEVKVAGAAIGEYTPVGAISKTATYTFAANAAFGQDITGFNGTTEESFLTAEFVPPSATLPSSVTATENVSGEAFEVQVKKTPAEEAPKWWVEGKLLVGSEAIAETTNVIKLFDQVLFKKHLSAETEFTVQCGEVKVQKGSIVAPSTREQEAIAYGACEVVGKPECAVAETKTNPLVATLEGAVGAEKLKFRPKSGSELIKWQILQVVGKPTCVQTGFYHADGQMTCDYREVEEELGEHPLEFTESSGSEVKVSGEVVHFSGTDAVHLASGKLWSAF